MQPEQTVSVVVVSYNTRDRLRRCLASIPRTCEVIVVDNASTDGSAQMVHVEFPFVSLVANSQNLGFGAANNVGSSRTSRKNVLFLNSDAYAEPGAIAELALALDRPEVVAAAGKLLNPDGTLQQSTANRLTLWTVFCEQTLLERLLPSSKLFSPYWSSSRIPDGGEVDQAMGACLMVRSGLERFDERFFLYVEDTELCARLRKHGTILYVPTAVFVHELGSSSQRRWEAVARYNRGKELYFSIHHGRAAMWACWLLDRLGALARSLFWLVATLATLGLEGRARMRLAIFVRVLTAQASGPPTPPRNGP